MTRFHLFWRRTVLAFYLSAKAAITPVAFGVNAIVLDKNGRVVMVRHSYMPGLHLPGGGVDRGEPPEDAVLRELREEIGLSGAPVAEFVGLFTRRFGWITNLIALYRVRDAEYVFKPNAEIREVVLVDPANLPDGIAPGARRRLVELATNAPLSPYW